MEELIKKIETAFANNVYPGDENLVSHSYSEKSEILRIHFKGTTDWRNLSADFLDQDGALAFFSDAAYLFFLPAYIIADIRGELKWNNPTVSLCWSFTPQSENKKIAKIFGGGTLSERDKERFRCFTSEQVSAIVSYLSWKVDFEGEEDLSISQALENYWLPREQSCKNKGL
jgi:hypothetical protein